MSERQMSDLLAQDAAVVGAGAKLADDVVERAKQHRRRRLAVWGACTSIALIAAIPLTVALNRSPRTAPHTQSAAGNHAAAPRPVSDTTQVYAAGVKYLAAQLVPGKHWRVLYISDQACTKGFGIIGPCAPRPIPVGTQQELVKTLRPYARVQFVAENANIRDKNLQVINDGVAVTLGRAALRGDTAQLPLWVQCGGLCGLGQTLILAKQNGAWVVTGSTGSAVIS